MAFFVIDLNSVLMTMAPGIFLPQEKCTKLKRVTIKETFQSRAQIQQVLMCTHYVAEFPVLFMYFPAF